MTKANARVAFLSFLVLLSCGGSKTVTSSSEQGGAAPTNAPSYASRIGIALSTNGRTCLGIRNPNVPPSTPVTLVTPTIPQIVVPAEIGATSESACPITKEVDTNVTNYELHLQNKNDLKKLLPLIAVVAPAASFQTGTNNDVRADMDANGKSESFRACSAADGLHLTVWQGDPLSGTLLWHGFYFQPDNTTAAPPCTPKETAAP